jgi:nucleoside-diphosphate-sugar epimerase
MAEELVSQYVSNGLQVVIVSPAKVYGPGHISHSLMMNAVILKFLKNRITFIPGPGTYKVSFAFIDDIVTGHILAMEKGKSGECYILGGPNVSYFEFFNRLRRLTFCKAFIVMLPKMFIQALARIQELNHKLWNTNVVFTVKSVDLLFCNNTFSSNKAVRELGYTITPLDEALQKTIQYLNHEKKV